MNGKNLKMWQLLPDTDKRDILNEVSARLNLPPSAIEKDWWVTMVLKAIFALSYAQHLVFKGGTSLSKGWNLIDRFSEDIDLALDRTFLGLFGGDLGKKQVTRLRQASFLFVSNQLLNDLHIKLTEMGITDFNLFAWESKSSDTDPEVLELQYSSVTESIQYIRPRVLIEVGARSLLEPFVQIPVQSLLGQTFNELPFADTPVLLPIVLPKRTFLEKAFLLHEEFLKADGSVRVDRMSRHLYDLFKLMDSTHGIEALQDEELYKTIVEHRQMFNAYKGMDYANHYPALIDFIPPERIREAWDKDYKEMTNSMIYGDAPEFDALLNKLIILRERFRMISWKH